MPELPEVETMVTGLRSALLGRILAGVRILEESALLKTSKEALRSKEGCRVVGLNRRGKFLLLHFSDGSVLLSHLKMTGRFLIVNRDAPGKRWERVHLEFADWDKKVIFVDQRKFGYLALIPADGAPPVPLLTELGPDALALSREGLREILLKSRRPVKALLLDQRAIAGLGNIYVDESLHGAGIHPRTPAAFIGEEDADRLYVSVQEILRRAIDRGGSTVRTYRGSGGEPGSFQREHRVYGRRGEACTRCGREIRYMRVASRGTHYCPTCQKPKPLRRKRRRGKG